MVLVVPVLSIRHFGGLRLSHGTRAEPLERDFPRSLFSFLSYRSGQIISRQEIADNLWPDLTRARARKAMNTAFWRLRRVESLSRFVHCPSRSTVTLALMPNCWVDTIAFERKVVTALKVKLSEPARARRLLEQAVGLYQSTAFSDVEDEWNSVR